jgi:hypothetical protein
MVCKFVHGHCGHQGLCSELGRCRRRCLIRFHGPGHEKQLDIVVRDVGSFDRGTGMAVVYQQ